ncbi:acyl-CoA thioesterase [Olivibacter sitiensis]|uniref:acyl-CoA thioesterase n=1 Tax=Olivibacter sitiensis TaxID=376470 RepID=UPI0004287591|nr:acyl-CoA thioesterase [Olivibacter sitiensis]
MTKRHTNIDLSQFHHHTDIQIRFADMDAFNHVNNAVYLTYLEIARTDYWHKVIDWNWDEMGIIIARSELDYILPITLTDRLKVYVKTTRVGKSSFDIHYILISTKGTNTKTHALGKTVCVCFDYKANNSCGIPQKYKERMEEDAADFQLFG